MIVDVIVCVLVADLLTGIIHWAEDTYGLPTWPLLGKSVIEPNILHHADPVHFTMFGVLYRNYQVFAISLAIGSIAMLFHCLTWQFALILLLSSWGNEVHAWTHKRPHWKIVRLMQEMKLLISPEQHAKHHRKPYDTNYCTLTNWLNPVLDAVRFWRAAEWLLSLVGVKVQRASELRGGY